MSLPSPGSTSSILRHLLHLRASPRGQQGGRFSAAGPTHARSRDKWVPPKDRVPFANIVVGDWVRLRRGSKIDDGKGGVFKGEGKVVSVDREKNLVWLNNEDNPALNPTVAVKHMLPRLANPAEGASAGYGPNAVQVAKPVHLSNLALMLPKDMVLPEGAPITKEEIKKGVVANRLSRSGVKFNRKGHFYSWTRYALVRAADGSSYRLAVPWPAADYPTRRKTAMMADSTVVSSESWLPWSPRDPIHLTPSRTRTSPHSELRADALVASLPPRQPTPPRRDGYAPFLAMKQPLPPTAQAPTPAEHLWMANEARASWVAAPEVAHHITNGGRTFATDDYLALCPADGPVSAAWRALPERTPAAAGARDENGRRLGARAGADEVDAWPLELLMQRELAPEKTRAKRGRMWQVTQTLKRAEREMEQREEKEAVRALKQMTL